MFGLIYLFAYLITFHSITEPFQGGGKVYTDTSSAIHITYRYHTADILSQWQLSWTQAQPITVHSTTQQTFSANDGCHGHKLSQWRCIVPHSRHSQPMTAVVDTSSANHSAQYHTADITGSQNQLRLRTQSELITAKTQCSTMTGSMDPGSTNSDMGLASHIRMDKTTDDIALDPKWWA